MFATSEVDKVSGKVENEVMEVMEGKEIQVKEAVAKAPTNVADEVKKCRD